ncbi:RecB family exonuclease [uncultured Jatrophihabitans sp.]|uniref:RecB family exonuclease n=1 Tax=uncultured Jatrophihabitans sp. TaxID=1610747 RepID=UPI0035C9D604
MPRRLFACTPSRLAAFDCPRRYRFTYLDRPAPARGQPWAHNTVGAATHVALHRWWLLPRSARTSDEGVRLLERNWQQLGFRDDAQSARALHRAAGWVRRYLDDLDPDAEPVGVERTVATRTDRLAVSGRVDRIDDRDGELVVVDYKTGRRPLTEDDARGSQALALYALGAQRTLRRDCVRVELHHLPSGSVVSADHTPQSLQRHVTRAESVAEDIVAATDTLAAGADADEVFPAAPGPGCSWCDFRRHCPAGQTVSRPLDAWAGLADPDIADPGAADPAVG